MAFLKFTDAESGADRLVNTQYVLYVERDTESAGAVIWWVSYRDPGQPQSRHLVTTQPAEEVFDAFLGAGHGS